VYVEQWGDMVLYVEGAPSSTNPDGVETDDTTWQIRRHVWSTQTRTSFDKAVEARKKQQLAD
jgi:hypothetical protein